MARIPSTENIYTGDGSTVVYQFHFPYLNATDVFVSVDTLNVPYTLLPGSTAQVQLAAAPVAGSTVRVYRDTLAITPQHLFDAGVPFLPRYVDENNRQLLYTSQEAINDTAVTSAEALVVADEAKQIAQAAEDKVDAAIIDSAYQLRQDLLNPITGGDHVLAGSRSLTAWAADAINVKAYGAKGDGVTDDTAAFEAAFAASKAAVGAGAFPYHYPEVVMPWGHYKISRTLLADFPVRLRGDRSIISATTGFTPAVVPKTGGGTQTMNYLLVLLHGSANDIAGQVQWSAAVDSGVILSGAFAVQGLYSERMPYSSFDCEVSAPGGHGIVIGAYSWGTSFNRTIVENWAANSAAIRLLRDSALNGSCFHAIRLWGEFTTPGVGIQVDADAGSFGVQVSGSFIEKCDYAVVVDAGNGPWVITGCDFEMIGVNVVLAAGSGGPITVDSCIAHTLDPIAPKFRANSKMGIIVRGCNLFENSVDFGTDATGYIVATDNHHQGGVVKIVPGANVRFESTSEGFEHNMLYLPAAPSDWTNTSNRQVFPFLTSPNVQGMGDFAQLKYAAGQYNTRRFWWTGGLNTASPSVLSAQVGIVLNNEGNVNEVSPMADLATRLGGPSARWTEVYAGNAAINVSDLRFKQDVRELHEAEQATAVRLRKLVRIYRMRDAVDRKGDDARLHCGVIAQEVEDAFAAEGLDAWDYSLLCFDEWPAREAVLDEAGTVVCPAVPAGESYGVRYTQLIMFILSVG